VVKIVAEVEIEIEIEIESAVEVEVEVGIRKNGVEVAVQGRFNSSAIS
jgi:hypothetical protein